MTDWTHGPLPHFSTKELACPETGQVVLQDGFGQLIHELRVWYAKPINVTSGCRSYSHNQAVGGAPLSLHLMGSKRQPTHKGTLAIDVRRVNSREDWELVALAMQLDFSIGIYRRHIHLDARFRLLGEPQALFSGSYR